MPLSQQIGIDKDIMQKLPSEVVQRQLFIFNGISLMLLVIGLISAVSATVYSLILFHQWFIAIGVGIFIGMVVFNLYRLFLMTGLDLKGSTLAHYHIKHENLYKEHNLHQLEGTAYQHPDEILKGWAQAAKDKLRDKISINPAAPRNAFTIAVRVFVMALLAVIFANGLEILMFSQQINLALAELKPILQQQPNDWTYTHILTPTANEPFILINANSLLLTFDTLAAGLGKWKLLLDVMVLAIYMIPLLVIYRSTEIRHGAYVQELALHEISKTTYHYLITQKYCHIFQEQIKGLKLEFRKYDHRTNKGAAAE